MKAVMLSVRPKWCEPIAIGKKTVEVRKNRPNLETPFKCYIYCTKASPKHFFVEWPCLTSRPRQSDMGKVIGEFICDDVFTIINGGNSFFVEGMDIAGTNRVARGSCLDYEDMKKYSGGKNIYGWHISGLKIYDEPRDLRQYNLKRPPQSWGYVDETEVENQ